MFFKNDKSPCQYLVGRECLATCNLYTENRAMWEHHRDKIVELSQISLTLIQTANLFRNTSKHLPKVFSPLSSEEQKSLKEEIERMKLERSAAFGGHSDSCAHMSHSSNGHSSKPK